MESDARAALKRVKAEDRRAHWEWCWDGHDRYPAAPPEGAGDPTGNASSPRRVLRGGDWSYDASYARVAFRRYNGPDFSYDRIGFRLARTLG